MDIPEESLNISIYTHTRGVSEYIYTHTHQESLNISIYTHTRGVSEYIYTHTHQESLNISIYTHTRGVSEYIYTYNIYIYAYRRSLSYFHRAQIAWG